MDVAEQQETSGVVYRMPPQQILDLVDADLDPIIMLQPMRKQVLLMLERPSMPSIAEVSAPELKLAGFRINPTTFCPSRADFALDVKVQLADDPERKQLPIKNFPINEKNKRHLGIGKLRRRWGSWTARAAPQQLPAQRRIGTLNSST